MPSPGFVTGAARFVFDEFGGDGGDSHSCVPVSFLFADRQRAGFTGL
jgi:hypothetical protein